MSLPQFPSNGCLPTFVVLLVSLGERLGHSMGAQYWVQRPGYTHLCRFLSVLKSVNKLIEEVLPFPCDSYNKKANMRTEKSAFERM